METKVEKNAEGILITINGRIDTNTSPEVRQVIMDAICATDTLTLDFAQVEYVSSAGIRVVLETEKLLHKEGKLKLINVNDVVKNVFAAIKLDKIIEMS